MIWGARIRCFVRSGIGIDAHPSAQVELILLLDFANTEMTGRTRKETTKMRFTNLTSQQAAAPKPGFIRHRNSLTIVQSPGIARANAGRRTPPALRAHWVLQEGALVLVWTLREELDGVPLPVRLRCNVPFIWNRAEYASCPSVRNQTPEAATNRVEYARRFLVDTRSA